ncbi:MAG TPA: TonB-dependent receptor [Polyangia bacterium]|nr:TonB-dependent receptor [Polyangia bacterium]
MNRIRRTATTLRLAMSFVAVTTLVGASRSALAQETTGRVVGSVVDQTSGKPIGGVTVIVQGPQGEDATITDDAGQYSFSSLPVGTYVIRYYLANTSTQVEQPGVKVSAEKTVRVNAKIATTPEAAAQQTYVITGKAPTVDVGSSRIGATFDEDFTLKLAVPPNYGAVISKAPGAFIDASGNVSIGGATGLENIYVVNGVNVTGLRYGNLDAGTASIGGGTNLPTEFLTQIDVNSGGYQAEFGGAMGGVINTVLKSGSNEFHGSVFASYAPYWLSADPSIVHVEGSALAAVRKPDFDDRIGFEVGGPLIKDKLFFWLGMAPQAVDTHVHRLTYALQDDGTGNAATNADGTYKTTFLPDATRRLNETHRTYTYAAKLDFIPAPEHRLELTLFGTPNFNNQMRSFQNGQEIDAAFPQNGQTTWAQEALTKVNNDVSAHWSSKLFDRHWQIDATAALHDEYFYQRSPDSSLNGLNQLEYHGSNLYDLEGIGGCAPITGSGGNTYASPFQPCPVNPAYHRGGFGTVQKYTANRWSGELKSTNIFEAGGHNELKYGWHGDLSTMDLERYYSGPPGARSLVWFDGSGVNTQNFYGLQGQYPSDFGSRYPYSDLAQSPLYKDELKADVKSLSNAFFVQESFSPAALRNLSINVGLRYEMQKMYDLNGSSFLSSDNLGPRVGAVFDPFNDGRSKVSANYGRFFEAIPMDLAARYFGGENYLDRYGVPPSSCANSNPLTWTGAGDYRGCELPAAGSNKGDVAGGYMPVNNSEYKQSHIQGQYQNEVVATLEREIFDDTSVRLDYTHRWLGTIVEDGYGDGTFVGVLGNPGHVPAEALADADKELADANSQAMTLQKASDAAAAAAKAAPMDTAKATAAADAASAAANAASAASSAQTKDVTLHSLANAPKPERTYDAISASVNHRLAKNWFLRGSYTWSRLVGNYDGLFQTQGSYYSPNGTNAYDTADLYLNYHGYLPNDHTHQAKVDGYYTLDAGPGKVTFGLSFVGRSGMPRSYVGNLVPGTQNQIVYVLPRGTAGRTPWMTQFDGHVGYQQKLEKGVTMEAYVDLFNIFNEQASLQADDNYTFDAVAPIENGTAKDLLFAKNVNGDPIAKNANFGHPIAYQAPFYTRLGLRLMF